MRSHTTDLCITSVPLELQNKDLIPVSAEAGFQQWFRNRIIRSFYLQLLTHSIRVTQNAFVEYCRLLCLCREPTSQHRPSDTQLHPVPKAGSVSSTYCRSLCFLKGSFRPYRSPQTRFEMPLLWSIGLMLVLLQRGECHLQNCVNS